MTIAQIVSVLGTPAEGPISKKSVEQVKGIRSQRENWKATWVDREVASYGSE